MFAGQFSGMASEAKITRILIICCVIASTGGFICGYCVAVTAGPRVGLLSKDSFLSKFYPVAYRRMTNSNPESTSSNYCLDDGFKERKPFVSSLHLAALTATFLASYTTRSLGRRHTMLFAGVFFIVGIMLSTAAQDLAMLFIGRILIGCGVGFTYQASPIYLSEIAPTRIRGALNILFQLNVRVGSLLARIVNHGIAKGGWGWRLSLGLAGIPATIFAIGSFFIVETPNSLIERGHLEKGKRVLSKIRGINNNIEPELFELVEASRVAKQVKHPFKDLLKRRNRPQLIITVVFKIFYWFSGIHFIKYYVPVFLQAIGYDLRDVGFYAFVTIDVVYVISTVISMWFVDKIGRRKLLLEAGLHMFLSHFLVAIILGIKVKDHSANVSHGLATFVVILICTFLSSYSWSWRALGWLIPSETFPLETRSAGQSVIVCVHFLFEFMIWSTFAPVLCSFKFGIFFFFSGWVLIMSLCVQFFLPETKNIPIEDMKERVLKRHWLWKRFLDDHGDEEIITR